MTGDAEVIRWKAKGRQSSVWRTTHSEYDLLNANSPANSRKYTCPAMDSNFYSVEMASIPGALTGPLPRKVRLSKNGNRMAIAAVVMFALGIVLTFWIGVDRVQHLLQRAALRRDGRTTVGQIRRVWSSSRSMKTRVSYTFAVNGVLFVGDELVPDH